MEDMDKTDAGPNSTVDDSPSTQSRSCALCGCSTPAVRCDRCNSQIFCLSCDDMYHKHPKRKLHLRKAVDSIWSSSRSPRLRRRTDMPGDPSKIPIPPPRTKKRERHTICGRSFLKPGFELGSLGFNNKNFDMKSFAQSHSPDIFAGQKSPAGTTESNYENDAVTEIPHKDSSKADEIYENEDAVLHQFMSSKNTSDNKEEFETAKTNISSPIEVTIPHHAISNGSSFNGQRHPHGQPHSLSSADLRATSPHPPGPHPYPFPHPYPYMHPPMMPPYSNSMAHMHCNQCLSSSWSSLMSPYPSPFFHPMHWASPHSTMGGGQQAPNLNGQMKHSHGDLNSPDPNFQYPYPERPFNPSVPHPSVNPSFLKELHHQTQMHMKKSPASSIRSSSMEEIKSARSDQRLDTAESPVATGEEQTQDAPLEGAKPLEEESEPVLPEKPTTPWECVHCTYINPPGSHICEVCCKTSYRVDSSKATEKISVRSNRDSESPMELINNDAIMHGAATVNLQESEKEISEEEVEQVDAVTNVDLESENQEAAVTLLTTETQTLTSTRSTDVQTQNLAFTSIASSTDSIFTRHEMSVQTDIEKTTQNCSVATDPMISSQSMESLLSGVSAPPYHNRRAGWGRAGICYSTQSLSAFERGRSRSPMPRSQSYYTEAQSFGRDLNYSMEDPMRSLGQSWLMSDPMYYKPNNLQAFGESASKDEYFDGTWGSMDHLNKRVRYVQENVKLDPYRKPRYHRSLDDLKSDKKPAEIPHSQELHFLQTVKEAERCGFCLEDLHVALLHCGKENPVFWLEDNWNTMIRNVIALAAKYGEDNEEKDVGAISTAESKEALRIHRGDIWDAVTECIENRQRKILELTVRGNFTQKQIADALKNNEGNVELAYADLVRLYTRKHKFILSPGLSEDSEDLNLYTSTEDGNFEATLSVTPIRPTKKADSPVESKAEKKRSDFLTKLSAIRNAQSERRKAREEKEMFRETLGSENNTDETNIASDLKASEKLSSKVFTTAIEEPVEVMEEAKIIKDNEDNLEDQQSKDVKKDEDHISVDFDTNWGDSQGEWIEEYSDEQWDDEGDGQWVALQKNFRKIEKEIEDDGMQMEALWEKDLEDDVFEDEVKDIAELDLEETVKKMDLSQSDRFDQWVKVNIQQDQSIPVSEEEEHTENLIAEAIAEDVLRDSLEYEENMDIGSDKNIEDLGDDNQLKSVSDWVDLQPDMKSETAEHAQNIIGGEPGTVSSDVGGTNSVQNSDDGWEKIEFDDKLSGDVQEMAELVAVDATQTVFPSNEFKLEIQLSNEALMTAGTVIQDSDYLNREKEVEEIKEDYKLPQESISNVSEAEQYRKVDGSESVTKEIEIKKETTGMEAAEPCGKVADLDIGAKEVEIEKVTTEKDAADVVSKVPPVPARRKSKLNAAAIEQVLAANEQLSKRDDQTPPALPAKMKSTKKHASTVAVETTLTDHDTIAAPDNTLIESVSNEPILTIDQENEKISFLSISKEASPLTSLSNDSDSNCFADSESDIEITAARQKYMHRKAAKYPDLEERDSIDDLALLEDENPERYKRISSAMDEQPSLPSEFPVESELVHSDDDNFLSDLRRSTDPFHQRRPHYIDDGSTSKAFRADTTRPLQLFKATKRESLEIPNQESLISPESVDPVVKHGAEYMQESTNQYFSDALQEPCFADDLTLSSEQMPSTAILPEPEDAALKFNAPENDYSPIVTDASEVFFMTSEPAIAEAQMFGNIDSTAALPYFEMGAGFDDDVPRIADVPSEEITEDIAFTDMEQTSAALDYFFGRYNEITVTKPKKKVATKQAKPSLQASPKTMSSSEMTGKAIAEVAPSLTSSVVVPSNVTITPSMTTSVTVPSDTGATLPMTKSLIEAPPFAPVQETFVGSLSDNKVVSEPVSISAKKVGDTASTECLSFAEDYFFGSYNEIVPVKKGKRKQAGKGQTSAGGCFQRTQSLQEKYSGMNVSDEEEKVETSALPSESATVQDQLDPVKTDTLQSSSTSDVLKPSETGVTPIVEPPAVSMISPSQTTPPGVREIELASDQSVQQSEIQKQQASEKSLVLDTKEPDENKASRVKVVHFEESSAPIAPPPRRTRPKLQTSASLPETKSFADEYLFGKYDEAIQPKHSLAKKKLLSSSQDFKLNSENELSKNCPETFLQPERTTTHFLLSSVMSVQPYSEELEVSPGEIQNYSTEETEIILQGEVTDDSHSFTSNTQTDILSDSIPNSNITMNLVSEGDTTSMMESSNILEIQQVPLPDEEECLKSDHQETFTQPSRLSLSSTGKLSYEEYFECEEDIQGTADETINHENLTSYTESDVVSDMYTVNEGQESLQLELKNSKNIKPLSSLCQDVASRAILSPNLISENVELCAESSKAELNKKFEAISDPEVATATEIEKKLAEKTADPIDESSMVLKSADEESIVPLRCYERLVTESKFPLAVEEEPNVLSSYGKEPEVTITLKPKLLDHSMDDPKESFILNEDTDEPLIQTTQLKSTFTEEFEQSPISTLGLEISDTEELESAVIISEQLEETQTEVVICPIKKLDEPLTEATQLKRIFTEKVDVSSISTERLEIIDSKELSSVISLSKESEIAQPDATTCYSEEPYLVSYPDDYAQEFENESEEESEESQERFNLEEEPNEDLYLTKDSEELISTEELNEMIASFEIDMLSIDKRISSSIEQTGITSSSDESEALEYSSEELEEEKDIEEMQDTFKFENEPNVELCLSKHSEILSSTDGKNELQESFEEEEMLNIDEAILSSIEALEELSSHEDSAALEYCSEELEDEKEIDEIQYEDHEENTSDSYEKRYIKSVHASTAYNSTISETVSCSESESDSDAASQSSFSTQITVQDSVITVIEALESNETSDESKQDKAAMDTENVDIFSLISDSSTIETNKFSNIIAIDDTKCGISEVGDDEKQSQNSITDVSDKVILGDSLVCPEKDSVQSESIGDINGNVQNICDESVTSQSLTSQPSLEMSSPSTAVLPEVPEPLDVREEESNFNNDVIDPPCELLMSHFYDEWIENVRYASLTSKLPTNASVRDNVQDMSSALSANESADEETEMHAISDSSVTIEKNYETDDTSPMFYNSSLVSSEGECVNKSIDQEELDFVETSAEQHKCTLSQSCQTDDSFEEDQFFDSSDNSISISTFPNNAYFEVPEQSTFDVGIQCDIITNINPQHRNEEAGSKFQIDQDVASTVSTELNVASHLIPIEITASELEPIFNIKDSPNKAVVHDDSSCESFEESDSDPYLESYSSQDELEERKTKKTAKKILSVEIDSDTGFSSGSDTGKFTQKEKQKSSSMYSSSAVERSHSVDSAQINDCNLKVSSCMTSSSEKESVVFAEDSTVSELVICSEKESHIISKSNETVDKSSQELSQPSENTETEQVIQDSPLQFAEEQTLPRAISPVAIEKIPTLSEDLTFIDIEDEKDKTESISENIVSKPTVEYFFGPLPEPVSLQLAEEQCIPHEEEAADQFFEPSLQLDETSSEFETPSQSLHSSDLVAEIKFKTNDVKTSNKDFAVDSIVKEHLASEVEEPSLSSESHFVEMSESPTLSLDIDHFTDADDVPDFNTREETCGSMSIYSDESFEKQVKANKKSCDSSKIAPDALAPSSENVSPTYSASNTADKKGISEKKSHSPVLSEDVHRPAIAGWKTSSDIVRYLYYDDDNDDFSSSEDQLNCNVGHFAQTTDLNEFQDMSKSASISGQEVSCLHLSEGSEKFLDAEGNEPVANTLPEEEIQHSFKEALNGSFVVEADVEQTHVMGDLQAVTDSINIELETYEISEDIPGESSCNLRSAQEFLCEDEILTTDNYSICQIGEQSEKENTFHSLKSSISITDKEKTKSSSFKEPDVPYIPELLLCDKVKDNRLAISADNDELTDISSHFTMTDDSDKYSDIESDQSLESMDYECISANGILDHDHVLAEPLVVNERGELQQHVCSFDSTSSSLKKSGDGDDSMGRYQTPIPDVVESIENITVDNYPETISIMSGNIYDVLGKDTAIFNETANDENLLTQSQTFSDAPYELTVSEQAHIFMDAETNLVEVEGHTIKSAIIISKADENIAASTPPDEIAEYLDAAVSDVFQVASEIEGVSQSLSFSEPEIQGGVITEFEEAKPIDTLGLILDDNETIPTYLEEIISDSQSENLASCADNFTDVSCHTPTDKSEKFCDLEHDLPFDDTINDVVSVVTVDKSGRETDLPQEEMLPSSEFMKKTDKICEEKEKDVKISTTLSPSTNDSGDVIDSASASLTEKHQQISDSNSEESNVGKEVKTGKRNKKEINSFNSKDVVENIGEMPLAFKVSQSLDSDLSQSVSISSSMAFEDAISYHTLTGESDKWSDVETDFSVEDFDFDASDEMSLEREKTPVLDIEMDGSKVIDEFSSCQSDMWQNVESTFKSQETGSMTCDVIESHCMLSDTDSSACYVSCDETSDTTSYYTITNDEGESDLEADFDDMLCVRGDIFMLQCETDSNLDQVKLSVERCEKTDILYQDNLNEVVKTQEQEETCTIAEEDASFRKICDSECHIFESNSDSDIVKETLSTSIDNVKLDESSEIDKMSSQIEPSIHTKEMHFSNTIMDEANVVVDFKMDESLSDEKDMSQNKVATVEDELSVNFSMKMVEPIEDATKCTLSGFDFHRSEEISSTDTVDFSMGLKSAHETDAKVLSSKSIESEMCMSDDLSKVVDFGSKLKKIDLNASLQSENKVEVASDPSNTIHGDIVDFSMKSHVGKLDSSCQQVNIPNQENLYLSSTTINSDSEAVVDFRMISHEDRLHSSTHRETVENQGNLCISSTPIHEDSAVVDFKMSSNEDKLNSFCQQDTYQNQESLCASLQTIDSASEVIVDFSMKSHEDKINSLSEQKHLKNQESVLEVKSMSSKVVHEAAEDTVDFSMKLHCASDDPLRQISVQIKENTDNLIGEDHVMLPISVGEPSDIVTVDFRMGHNNIMDSEELLQKGTDSLSEVKNEVANFKPVECNSNLEAEICVDFKMMHQDLSTSQNRNELDGTISRSPSVDNQASKDISEQDNSIPGKKFVSSAINQHKSESVDSFPESVDVKSESVDSSTLPHSEDQPSKFKTLNLSDDSNVTDDLNNFSPVDKLLSSEEVDLSVHSEADNFIYSEDRPVSSESESDSFKSLSSDKKHSEVSFYDTVTENSEQPISSSEINLPSDYSDSKQYNEQQNIALLQDTEIDSNSNIMPSTSWGVSSRDNGSSQYKSSLHHDQLCSSSIDNETVENIDLNMNVFSGDTSQLVSSAEVSFVPSHVQMQADGTMCQNIMKDDADSSIHETSKEFESASYNNYATESDKWSDVENDDMFNLSEDLEFKQVADKAQISSNEGETIDDLSAYEEFSEIVYNSNLAKEDNVSHQEQKELNNLKPASEFQNQSNQELSEQFATETSINDQMSIADTFLTYGMESAISKVCDDDATDVSSHFDKTEDLSSLLESQTDHSSNELGHEDKPGFNFSFEDFQSNERGTEEYSSATEEKYVLVKDETDVPSLPFDGNSDSSFMTARLSLPSTDVDFSKSDTCADAELSSQVATTEDSDRWSDMEADISLDGAQSVLQTIPSSKQSNLSQDSNVHTSKDDNFQEWKLESSLKTNVLSASDPNVVLETESSVKTDFGALCTYDPPLGSIGEGFSTKNEDSVSKLSSPSDDIEQNILISSRIEQHLSDPKSVAPSEDQIIVHFNDPELSEQAILKQNVEALSLDYIKDRVKLESLKSFEESAISSDQSLISTSLSGLSDEEFTDVSPLNLTSEDSENWSDIEDASMNIKDDNRSSFDKRMDDNRSSFDKRMDDNEKLSQKIVSVEIQDKHQSQTEISEFKDFSDSSNQKVEKKVKDEKVVEEKVKDQKVVEEKVKDQKGVGGKEKAQNSVKEKMNDQKVVEEKLKDQEVVEEKVKDQKVVQEKVKDQKLSCHDETLKDLEISSESPVKKTVFKNVAEENSHVLRSETLPKECEESIFQDVNMPNEVSSKPEGTFELHSIDIQSKQEFDIQSKQELDMQFKQELDMQSKQELDMQSKQELDMQSKQEQSKQELDMQSKQEQSKQELDMQSKQELNMQSKQELDMQSKQELDMQSKHEFVDESQVGDTTIQYQDDFTNSSYQVHTISSSDKWCDFEANHSLEDYNEENEMHPEMSGNFYDLEDDYSPTDIMDEDEIDAVIEDTIESIEHLNSDLYESADIDYYGESYVNKDNENELNVEEVDYASPYNNWIEESFELKDYGIDDDVLSGDEEIYGHPVHIDDDEDIQLAIDMNIIEFDADADIPIPEDSFKTLSNNISSAIKTTDKESDSWSTADAPSIEEDVSELNVCAEFKSQSDPKKINQLKSELFNFESAENNEQVKDFFNKELVGSSDTKETEIQKISDNSYTLTHKSAVITDEVPILTPNTSIKESVSSKFSVDAEQTSISETYIRTEQSSSRISDGQDVSSAVNKNDVVCQIASQESVLENNLLDKTNDTLQFKNNNSVNDISDSNSGKAVTKVSSLSDATNLKLSLDNGEKQVSASYSSASGKCSVDSESYFSNQIETPDALTEKSEKNILKSSNNQDSQSFNINKEIEQMQQKVTESINDEDSVNCSFSLKTQEKKLEKGYSERSDSLEISSDAVKSIKEKKSIEENSATSALKLGIEEKKPTTSIESEASQTIVMKQETEKSEVLASRSVERKMSSDIPEKKSKPNIPSEHHEQSEKKSVADEVVEIPPTLSLKKVIRKTSKPQQGTSETSFMSKEKEINSASSAPEVPETKSKSPKASVSEDSSTKQTQESNNGAVKESADLSKKRLSIDERVLKLQMEGKCMDRDKAFIAAKLIEMQFEEEEALHASKQCNSVYNAITFLTQLCELCNCRFPVNLMASMVHCPHRACKECLKAHFTTLIYDRSIFTLLCPICLKPDITDQNMQEYFNHLDMMLRSILDSRVYDLFQRKLRDEVLTKDPNFHWCSQCSSGFIASPRLKKLYCPDCSAITCALCHQTWELEHEGVHCERFQQWKDMHTPEPPPAGLVKKLTERGIACPSCGIIHPQACGGCMLYKCSHCSCEFCGFCIMPFKRGKDCKKSPACSLESIHAHHTINCLFFLRDKDLSELQLLLEEESVNYITIPPRDQIVKSRCQVREQKHNHGIISEDRCGRDIEPYCAGLCRTHYYEYITELIRNHKINALSIMTTKELQFMLRKSRIFVPDTVKGETADEYHSRLSKELTKNLS